MFKPLIAAGLLAAAGAMPGLAATVDAASLFVFIDADLAACDGSVTPSPTAAGGTTFCDGSVRPDATFKLPIDERGRFSTKGLDLAVLGDGSVVVADPAVDPAEGRIVIDFEGEIFPMLAAAVSVADAGAPTTFTFVFSTLIPTLTGAATFEAEGSIIVPERATATASLPSGALFDYKAGGAVVATLGSGAISPPGADWSTDGAHDCGAGCDIISLSIGFKGSGAGAVYGATSRFDLDAATLAPVPLPASAWLLAAGLGLLAARGRMRGRAA